MPNTAITKLQPYFEKMSRLKQLLSILNFDVETKAPAKGMEKENDLIAFYSAEYARIAKDREFIALVKEAEELGGLNDAEALNIEDLLDEIRLMEKLPIETYIEWEKDTSKCIEMWRKAKRASDWSMVKPYFEKLVANKKKEAVLLAKPGQKTLYDAFLSTYEKGQLESDIDAVFGPLKEFLIANLPAVLERQGKIHFKPLDDHPKHEQEDLAYDALKAIDYELDRGALGEVEHPFSDNIARDDCRVTTHYHIDDWRCSLYSILHEGGHAIQFQNWSDYEFDNNVDGRASAALCETHSRFYENLIGRSKEFASILLPICQKDLGGELKNMDVDDFYHLVNKVERSLVRTEADEYTYCLHIILRYELERDLINGKLSVDELPAAWNAKYKEYLGIEVPSDAKGILQDVHWFQGSFGYFPSYALGNLYGAQIMAKMKEDLDVSRLMSKGNLAPIKAWLRQKDFAYDYLDPKDWITKVTGKAMDPNYFISYIKEKFLG